MSANPPAAALPLRAASLFTGCGGMDLGFERAGIETVLQCEIDPACLSVLERHWPAVHKVNDVRSIVMLAPHDNIDVIHFGSPCQDLSTAGKRKGFDGERSGLFTEAIRLIRGASPGIVVWENVGGSLSSADGADFATALDLLADAGALDIAWRVLDAQWFGVAERRRRVFVVADFRAHRSGEILFEPEGSGRHPQARLEAGQDVAATLTSGSHGAGTSAPGRRQEDDINLVVDHERAGPLGGGAYGTGRRTEDDPNLVLAFKGGQGSGARSLGIENEVSPTLTAAESGSNRAPVIAYSINPGQTGSNGRRWGEEIAFMIDGSVQAVAAPLGAHHSRQDLDVSTYIPERAYAVRARDGKGIGFVDGDATLVAAVPMRVRRLTPLECERLQGMPDGWTATGAKGERLSDTQRYRMIGNSVAVPVVEWIARRIVAAVAAS